MFMHLVASRPANKIFSKWPGFIRHWSRCWTFSGSIDIYIVPQHCCSNTQSLLKKLWDTIWEFSSDDNSTYPVYNNHSHKVPLWLCLQPSSTARVIKCPSADSTWPQTPPVFFLWVWLLIFLPLSMEPTLHQCVSKPMLFGSPCYVIWNAIRSSLNI